MTGDLSSLYGFSVEQMLGKPTIHIPINMIVQEAKAEEGKFWGIWQCSHENAKLLTFDSKATHQLILGDAYIRPNMVLDSDAFVGSGISNIACNAMQQTDKWNRIYHRS